MERESIPEPSKSGHESFQNGKDLGYELVMKEENMYSNKGLDLTKSVIELEEDFM